MRAHAPARLKGGARQLPRPGSAQTAQAPRLPPAKLLDYERKGWCFTKSLLPKDHVLQLKQEVQQHVQQHKLSALKHRVRVLCPDVSPSSVTSERQAMKLLRTQGEEEVGFLQFFHLHRQCPVARSVVFSPELAGTAAQLLGCSKVRVYQDCVFLKEPGYAPTNWHSDLRMAPFDTNGFVTAWVPLRAVKGGEGDSGLVFAEGSHRDFAAPFWHELQGLDLGGRGYSIASAGSMAEGDVTWHHGWTLHYAPPQPPGTPTRLALAVSYFADGARLLARQTDPSVRGGQQEGEDLESYSDWLGDLKDGAVARHRLLPAAWPAQAASNNADMGRA